MPSFNTFLCWRSYRWGFGALTVAAAMVATAQPMPQVLSFGQARESLQAQSPQLAAHRKAVDSAQWRREGMQGLGGPSVGVSGTAYRYALNAQLDTSALNGALANAAAQQPPPLGAVLGGLQLPATYPIQRQGTSTSASVSAIWPVYMGGLADAVREGLDGQSQEAQADAALSQDQLHTLLVQRYFGAQLAQQAAALRHQALQGVRAHDAAAQRMLQAGVIARVDRLQASAALAQAQQDADKAHHDAQLAATALARTLHADMPVQPSTPLFVDVQPLAPLHSFQDAALQLHPGLRKVAAKQTQAQALKSAGHALRQPQVLAFGAREVNTEGKPNWAAGVAVRWTLWDSLDRDKLDAASQASVDQAQLSAQQLRSDIALLVEKNWWQAEHARTQYLSGQAQEEVAQELLRLRSAGLQAGTSTPLEVIDAQLNVAKVQTTRASAANDYVQALAALLESSSQTAAFEDYVARAAVLITPETP